MEDSLRVRTTGDSHAVYSAAIRIYYEDHGSALARGQHGLGSGLDEPGHLTGVGDHRDVARRDLDGGGAHPGGELPFGIRRERLVAGVTGCQDSSFFLLQAG